MTEVDDELAELERRMRRNLFFNGKSNRSGLSEEEQRIAVKLLGKSETERLQKRRNNSRPFKPKRPIVVAEYYEVPPMQTTWGGFAGGGWRIDVRENGVVRNSRVGMTREECLSIVGRLERRGVQGKPIVTEWMKQNPSCQNAPPATKRKSFDERYGGFDPEFDV